APAGQQAVAGRVGVEPGVEHLRGRSRDTARYFDQNGFSRRHASSSTFILDRLDETPRDVFELAGAGAPALVEAYLFMGIAIACILVHRHRLVTRAAVVRFLEGDDGGEGKTAAIRGIDVDRAVSRPERAGPDDALALDHDEEADRARRAEARGARHPLWEHAPS